MNMEKMMKKLRKIAINLIALLAAAFMMVFGEKFFKGSSWRLFALFSVVYALCAPIKDFKDLEGDKKNGIWTIPAIFGEDRARMIVAVSFFVSYMLSVFFLNEFRLFWWALLFGGASFFTIQNRNIKNQKLIWWNLRIAFVYGLILVKVVFVS